MEIKPDLIVKIVNKKGGVKLSDLCKDLAKLLALPEDKKVEQSLVRGIVAGLALEGKVEMIEYRIPAADGEVSKPRMFLVPAGSTIITADDETGDAKSDSAPNLFEEAVAETDKDAAETIEVETVLPTDLFKGYFVLNPGDPQTRKGAGTHFFTDVAAAQGQFCADRVVNSRTMLFGAVPLELEIKAVMAPWAIGDEEQVQPAEEQAQG